MDTFAAFEKKYDTDAYAREVDEQIAQTRKAETKIHKKIVSYQIAELNKLPFKAILNHIDLPCGLTFTCKHFLATVMNIDKSSPEEVRDVEMYEKIYFPSEKDQQSYIDCKKGDLKDFYFYSHSVAKSPAPVVVKHRQFYVAAKFCRVGEAYRIYMKSIPEEFAPQYEGSVTGQLMGGYFEFTGDNSKSRIEEYLLADPAGNIPGTIYNIALGDRNEVLLFALKLLEQLKKNNVE